MENSIHLELANLKPAQLDAGEIFSGTPSGTMIHGYAQPSLYTPKVDSDYIFHEASRDLIVWFLNPREPLYVFGPTGCGKTSCIKQLAARLNYPVFEVTGHGRLEFADLVGHLSVQNGNMVFEHGPLALAMRYGGLFLFNEIDLTSPEVAAGLNGILDGSPLCISENGGELIMPHPLFRFAATANTNGGGDESGLYQGTQRQNLAFADRFILCEIGYPKKEVEVNLLMKKYSTLPPNLCETMVDFANEIRKLFMGDASSTGFADSIEVTFSTRSLLRWADLMLRFQPLAMQGIQPVTYALDRALAYRASRESRAMLHELAQRMFPRQETTVNYETVIETAPKVLTGQTGINYITSRLSGLSSRKEAIIHLKKRVSIPDGDFSKDWIAHAQVDNLVLRFGPSGNVNRTRFYRASECKDENPIRELISRASRKLLEGYEVIEKLCAF